MAPNIIT